MSATMPPLHSVRRVVDTRERGFTLVELLVSLAITTVILGATMAAMSDAVKATDSATQITTLNNGLRTAMDLMVRDLMQTGQGLPAGRVIGLPNGNGSNPIQLPGPPGTNYQFDGASFCPPDPDDPSPDSACEQITAIVPGPGLGPQLTESGTPTDMMWIVAADSAFERVPLSRFAPTGRSIEIHSSVNITDGGADDLHAGDLIMLSKGSASVLLQVTEEPTSQEVRFDTGDSMNMNQSAAYNGTLHSMKLYAPPDNDVAAPGGRLFTEATRIRMTSYYIDAVTVPGRPRLVRRGNNGDPLIFDNTFGTAVAFDIENMQITYDIADGVTNPSNVRMTDADLDGSGACAPRACSPNQIRKVNLLLSGRSPRPMRITQQFFHNTLSTQVSLRSLAFVDRYR
jgi:prepilin-type N-terminal cleavage/methylation domain-containing protein